MTKDWTFNVTDTTRALNLWYDLIAPTVSDLTFSNVPYIPSMVQELEIQNQTPGSNITRNGMLLTGGSWDVKRSAVNSIDLKSVTLQTDSNPTVIYVTITAN